MEEKEIVEGDYNDLERASAEYQYSRRSSFLQSLGNREEYKHTNKRNNHAGISKQNVFFMLGKINSQITYFAYLLSVCYLKFDVSYI